MAQNKNLISIGMPVYNGERHIRQALDSLLAQDYENFELIISDNASTDGTHQICQEYSARDKRIRYYRSDRNMGATWNLTRIFELSSGEYFMWASHDDYWQPQYLRSCLKALTGAESIILAGAMCDLVDSETGKLIFTDVGFSTTGLRPRERFVRYRSIVHGGRYIGGVFYGIYRRSALREVIPVKKVIAGDQLILAELCFHGEFITVPQKLMTKRYGGASASHKKTASASHKKTASAIGIKNPVLIKFPYFVREILLQAIILKTDKLTAREKIQLCLWSLNHYVRVCVVRSARRKFRRKFQGPLSRVKSIPRQLLGNIRRWLA